MSETLAAGGGVKTYRGSSIEELLPRIREDLGPEAVILRQREGLVGGVGGFFQKRCIEVEARAGGPGIDVYDEESPAPDDEAPAPDKKPPAADEDPPRYASAGPPTAEPLLQRSAAAEPLLRNDAATREGLESPAVQQIVAEAQPFADLLGQLSNPTPGSAVPFGPIEAKRNSAADGAPGRSAQVEAPERSVGAEAPGRSARGEALVEGMVAAGLGGDIAAEVVDAVLASALPFATPARLRTLVRDQLALRLPVAPAAAPGPRAIALVGPAGAGKTAAAARICAAHAAAGAAVTCLAIAPSGGGAALRQLLGDAEVQVVVAENPANLPTPTELHHFPVPYQRKSDAVRGGSSSSRLLVVDTPPAWAEAPGLPALARALKKLGLDEVHAVLRAGTAAAAGNELVEGLRPLRPNRLLATGLGETGHLGSIADVAIRAELPLGYLAEGPAELAPAEPRALASRIVP